jgi:hypothetical protein
MPGTLFWSAVSMTVDPASPSTLRDRPVESLKVIWTIGASSPREARPDRAQGSELIHRLEFGESD